MPKHDRVTIIPTYFYPSYGGLQNFTVRLARAIESEGIPVEIHALYPVREIVLNPIPTDLRVNLIHSSDRIDFWRQILATMREQKRTHSILAIGLELEGAADKQLFCLSELAKSGHRVCLRVATSDDITEVVDAEKAAYLRDLQHIILLNPCMHMELQRILPGYDRVSIVPIIVDTSRFHPVSEEERSRVRSNMQLPPEKWVCMWTGRLHPVKQVEVVLQTWRTCGLDGTLLIVGSDESRGQAYLKKLQGLAASQRGAEVRFMPAVPECQMPSVYAAGDCLLFTSRREGMCNSVVEALCCGLQVVACDIPGVRVIKQLVPEASLHLATTADSQELAGLVRLAHERITLPRKRQSAQCTAVFGAKAVVAEFRRILNV